MLRRSLPLDGAEDHHSGLPVHVFMVPMTGRLIGATDVDRARVYVREDASHAEIGAAILDGAREVAEAWLPTAGSPDATVVPLPLAEDREEDERGLG